MLGSRTLLTSVAEEAKALAVEPDGCARGRAVAGFSSACVACVEVCPSQAISLDPLALDEARCDGCGACSAACPTQALSPGSSGTRDAFRLLLSKPDEVVHIACSEAHGVSAAHLTLPCLAGLPWELPVALLLRGATGIELRSGDCARCARAALSETVEAHCDAARRGAAALSLAGVERKTSTHGDRTRSDVEGVASGTRSSRRGLFTGLLRRSRNVVERAGASVVERTVGALTDAEVAELDLFWLRKLMTQALGERSGDAPVTLPRAAEPVVTDACTPCPLCSASCPSTALVFRERPGELVLSLVPELCTGCGACADVCPQLALEISPRTRLSTWGVERTLAQASTGGCERCGEPALSRELPYCARCYREGHGLERDR